MPVGQGYIPLIEGGYGAAQLPDGMIHPLFIPDSFYKYLCKVQPGLIILRPFLPELNWREKAYQETGEPVLKVPFLLFDGD